MDEPYFEFVADPAHIAKERAKAKELRKSAWWQRKTQKGICAYCEKPFPPKALTMDHIVPLARGGRSNKGNLVPSCKDCNNKKKLATPAELALLAQDLAKASSEFGDE